MEPSSFVKPAAVLSGASHASLRPFRKRSPKVHRKPPVTALRCLLPPGPLGLFYAACKQHAFPGGGSAEWHCAGNFAKLLLRERATGISPLIPRLPLLPPSRPPPPRSLVAGAVLWHLLHNRHFFAFPSHSRPPGRQRRGSGGRGGGRRALQEAILPLRGGHTPPSQPASLTN